MLVMIEDTRCVYLYRNPLDQKIFYIGEGTIERALNLNNHTNTNTKRMIDEISRNNKTPMIEFLRENIDKETAQMYEGVAIDVIGLENLTNEKHGKGSNRRINREIPRMPSEELRKHLNPDEANITERVILIRINQLYRSGMDADSLYDATRGVWVIGPRRERAEYAFAVFKGIVKQVYKIKHPWYLAGTKSTFYKTRPDCNDFWESDPPRWEFEGEIAESNVCDKYLDRSVKSYLSANSQNPIKYVNIP
jgi:uncharacterized protein